MESSPEPVDPAEIVKIHDPEIDVDGLMRQIRTNLMQRRAQAEAMGLNFEHLALGRSTVPSKGRFRPELYENLFLANMTYDRLHVSLKPVTPTRVPLVQGLLEGIKRRVHQVALHYVQSLAAQQATFNGSVVKVLNELVEELNDSPDANVRQRLTALERLVRTDVA